MSVPCILRKHRDYGKISARRLFYLHGQGDTRARPAAALVANFTMPLRGHGKISARRLFYLHGQGDTRAQPAAALMANFTCGGCSAALVECSDWRYPIHTAP